MTVTDKSEELLQARRVQSNIAVVVAQLNLCLPVLTTYAKLKRQIADKRYTVNRYVFEVLILTLHFI